MRWRGRPTAPPGEDRRMNPSYSQHASLVYTPVPIKKILYAPGGAGGVRGSQLQWRRTRSTRRASWRYHNISKCYNKEKKSFAMNNMRKLLLEVVDSRAVLKILLRIFSVLL
ncbi:uncharacterized protein LOC125531460 isoform X2 [Triticum urartu]|uniref:uncharacterized protein LOC125531460 isoform X2 n=2 Tax=Triticum urartu TaxID=4572 RepID=UPI0020431CA3|nr:uncharacterized protein LOC125531460 isoform X2 [Triticum urartu]